MSVPCRHLLIIAMFSTTGPARADGVDDLLKQAEQALGTGTAAKPKDTSKTGDKKPRPATPRATTSATPPPATPSEAALRPTDIEDVSKLLTVTRSEEAKMRASVAAHGYTVAVGAARLSGDYRLEKDDDTFRNAAPKWIGGASAAWRADFSPKAHEVQVIGGVVTGWRLDASLFRGDTTVDRTGITNESFTAGYNLVALAPALTVRNARERGVVWTAGYGPAAELLVQIGRGDSDSTSGWFASDALSGAVGWKADGGGVLELGVAARGLLPLDREKPGAQTLMASLYVPVSG